MSDIDIRYTKKEYAVKRRENDGGEREREKMKSAGDHFLHFL